jgi:hypothetical protein
MRYPLLVALALGLALAFPAPARADSYLSLQWADRPVCVLLADCIKQWRVRARYEAAWTPPWSWAPTLFTDGDVVLQASPVEALHVEPLHGWFGAGLDWQFGDLSLRIGGLSGHYFGRTLLFPGSDGTPATDPARQTYNYIEVRWGGQ